MNKYGKPLSNVINFKQTFINNDAHNKKYAFKKNELYRKQPTREFCKICSNKLGDIDFYKNKIGYIFCNNCGHLNGERQDTNEFIDQLYSLDGGSNYAQKYSSVDRIEYKDRVNKIYTPKAKFLIESICEKSSFSKSEFKFCDIGAGSGYFVSALNNSGVDIVNLSGLEVSEVQASYANMMLGQNIIKKIGIRNMLTEIKNIDANIVSLIGVLEHLQNPFEVIEEIKSNKNIEYLFISVPLFSPTVLFEMIFTGVTDRHLTGSHTHLFTEQSLSWLENTFNLDVVSSWWFGMDIFDLYRSMIITFKDENSANLPKIFSDYFVDIMDDLQLVLDKKHRSSEVHILYKL